MTILPKTDSTAIIELQEYLQARNSEDPHSLAKVKMIYDKDDLCVIIDNEQTI